MNIWVDNSSSTNLLSETDFENNTSRQNGYVAGNTLSALLFNSILRQNSLIVTSLIEQFCPNAGIGLRSDKSTVKSALSNAIAAKSDIINLQSNLNVLATTVNSHTGTIQSHTSAINTLDTSVNTLDSNLQIVRNDVDELDTDLGNLSQRVDHVVEGVEPPYGAYGLVGQGVSPAGIHQQINTGNSNKPTYFENGVPKTCECGIVYKSTMNFGDSRWKYAVHFVGSTSYSWGAVTPTSGFDIDTLFNQLKQEFDTLIPSSSGGSKSDAQLFVADITNVGGTNTPRCFGSVVRETNSSDDTIAYYLSFKDIENNTEYRFMIDVSDSTHKTFSATRFEVSATKIARTSLSVEKGSSASASEKSIALS